MDVFEHTTVEGLDFGGIREYLCSFRSGTPPMHKPEGLAVYLAGSASKTGSLQTQQAHCLITRPSNVEHGIAKPFKPIVLVEKRAVRVFQQPRGVHGRHQQYCQNDT